jgi:hypothetical protein
MPSSSSPSSTVADQFENDHVAVAATILPTPAGTNQPRPLFLDLPTEIHIEIFKHVLVEGDKLYPYPHTTRYTRAEPRLET